MQKYLVMTVSGNDRPGIVEHVTKLLLDYQSNVEASRMARLGGEFVMLMLVSADESKFEDLREAIRQLREQDFRVTTRATERGYSVKYAGWIPYEITVRGADHEGIVHQVTRHLAKGKANIESMDTEVVQAPMSGAPLFTMTAIVLVPPETNIKTWREALVLAGDERGVDIEASPYVR